MRDTERESGESQKREAPGTQGRSFGRRLECDKPRESFRAAPRSPGRRPSDPDGHTEGR